MTGERPARRSSPRRVGWLAGLSTVAFLLVGVGRSFDLDSSITTGYFVATPSLSDPFEVGYVFNNHIFFSFLEHLVYSTTGSQASWLMRLLPILCSGAAVGAVATAVATRWGAGPAAAAAALVATNPVFADVGSQVRGYSLVTWCAVVSSVVLWRALRSGSVSPAALVAYGVAGAVGVATHGYMVAVLAIHLLVALSAPVVAQRFVVAWLGSALGLTAYAWQWRYLADAIEESGRRFRPSFPVDLAVELGGGSVVAAVLVGALAAPALWRARRSRRVQLAAAGVAAVVVAAWLSRPYDLYPRFFVWLVPLPAVAVARTVAWGRDRGAVVRRVAGAAVAVAVVAQLWVAVPLLRTDPYGNAAAAAVFARVEPSRDGAPCVASAFEQLLMAGYPVPAVLAGRQVPVGVCGVLVTFRPLPERTRARVRVEFPHAAELDAATPATLWSRVPTSCWLGPDDAGSRPARCERDEG